MGTQALIAYGNAREALRRGAENTAAAQLGIACGGMGSTQVIRDNVAKLLDHQTLAGALVLELIRVEVGRRRGR